MKKAKLFFMALALMGGVNLAKAGDASSLGSASDTEWTWTSNESNDIYSGSTVTLKGVVVTIGSSSQTDHKWTYNATNGYLPTNTANVSGTGVAGFSVTSPYGTLPNQGGFLKIVPSTSGTLTITISPSGNGTIPNIFVTTSDGSTITAAESTGKQATTNTYSVTAGNTYYFFPEAQTTSNITTYRWYLQSISFTDETAQIAAAKAELNTLITQAKSYHDNSSDANGAQATLASAYGDAETVYNNASASLSAITSAVSTLTAAIQTFVTSGAKPINGTYFDLTSVIKDPECNSNDNWDGSGRVFGTGKHWSGDATRQYFEKNGKGDFGQNRSQTITLPVAGNYLLKTAIYNVSDEEIWETRMALKNKLTDYIRTKFRENWLKNQGDPSRVLSLLHRINPNALMIGFCRRFATYKRAHLLFTDLERLEKIVNDPERPVQFLFSGKAHPADGAGQGLIKRIYEISQRPEFLGKIIFLEDYDFRLARRLVSGVDIWMNTPTRPMEASGTSGEKAEMNGVVNLSVLDGWWLEGYREGAGWALTEKRTYQNQGYQDQLDAATIYGLLENEIIPLYYDKDKKGLSKGWIKVVKNSIAQIAPHYTMKRQLDDYYSKFYEKQAKRFKELSKNDNRLAKDIAMWKEAVAERWDAINVVSCEWNFPATGAEAGSKYTLKYVINEQGLDDAIGLEKVNVCFDKDGNEKVFSVEPLKMTRHEGNNYTFEAELTPRQFGQYKSAVRMYPKNKNLPHRQDFCYVKWLELPNF